MREPGSTTNWPRSNLHPAIDAAGNSWATLRGTSDRTVLIGGHSTRFQTAGGSNGTLGVLAAFEALRMFKSAGRRSRSTLVDWADEEGARFGRSLLGSSAASGSLVIDEVARWSISRARTLADALRENGVDIDRMLDAHRALKTLDARAYLELHIEQGPVLESMNKPTGVVIGICVERVTCCALSVRPRIPDSRQSRCVAMRLLPAAERALAFRDIASRLHGRQAGAQSAPCASKRHRDRRTRHV